MKIWDLLVLPIVLGFTLWGFNAIAQVSTTTSIINNQVQDIITYPIQNRLDSDNKNIDFLNSQVIYLNKQLNYLNSQLKAKKNDVDNINIYLRDQSNSGTGSGTGN